MNIRDEEENIVVRARRLRRNMTPTERTLWRELRNRRLCGAKFRRQKPMGHYIVDFICDEAKLIVEIDGGQHGVEALKADDLVRTRWLEARGFRVMRFWNPDVLENIDGVLSAISEELMRAAKCPGPSPGRHPSPLPPSGRGDGCCGRG